MKWGLVIFVLITSLYISAEYPHLLFPASLKKEEFATRYGKYAVIAGASEGLGESWAKCLAERGLNIIMIARRKEKLEATAHNLRKKYGVKVETISLDLAAENAETTLRGIDKDYEVGIAVYNAAFSNMGDFLENDVKDVNIKGPIIFSHIFGNSMRKRRRGGIVLMTSMQGERGGAQLASYAASKAWNTRFAESLWYELSKYNIDVLGVVAGAVRTPNYLEIAGDRGKAILEQLPDDVVEESIQALGKTPRFETGTLNKLANQFMKLLPSRLGIAIISSEIEGTFTDMAALEKARKRLFSPTGSI